MGLYGHCAVCYPGMGGVGPLLSYGLLVLDYYVVVNVVLLVVHLTIVFKAVALVVHAISAALLLRVMVVDYRRYISLSVVRVIRRRLDLFWFRGIASVRI